MHEKSQFRRIAWFTSAYTAGFIALLVLLAILERQGVPRTWIGYLFMFSTIVVYASIGILSRTSDVSEYYVAGRRVPALFNGMATAADWISAATFISLAGGLYLQGFDGLAYIIGWTGGYCLVALLIAPYLRKFGQFTIPDFLAARYQGRHSSHPIRIFAVIATILISFIYVVAQIYGVGLITSRFTGVDFSIGIFLGLASILVCSFLGGMRAITWTQVAQYIIIFFAYLIPVIWLMTQHAHHLAPHTHSILSEITLLEKKINRDQNEIQIRTLFKEMANDYETRLHQLPGSWQRGYIEAQQQLEKLKHNNASLIQIRNANRALANYPKTPEEAQRIWQQNKIDYLARAEPPTPQATPFPGESQAISNSKRINFLALVFCLMLGTAALPHILTRYYTTSSVQQTRKSVFWTLFFILLIYLTAPALALLVKYIIYTTLVGSDYAHLPNWVSYWANIDKTHPLINITDINHDGIVQLAEINLDGDMIMLATPEIAGLPYFISGLVAAGGLAAALSTADGLLLTISNTLSHDVYYKMINPHASSAKRVTVSKLLLLVVALLAAYTASLKPGDILSMVGAAFSLAASTLFPVLALGVFWKRGNQQGAIAAIVVGFVTCTFYILRTYPTLGGSIHNQWFHINPMAAGIFGVPAGILALIIVSLLSAPPTPRTLALIKQIRAP